MAAIGAGLTAPETDWARIAQVVEPNPDVRPLYDEMYALYGCLYPATIAHTHALAQIQEHQSTQQPVPQSDAPAVINRR